MYASSSTAHSLTNYLSVFLPHGRHLRNINRVSIDYALRPRLRSRLTPCRRTWARETLGLRRPGFSPGFSLLMSASSLPCAPRVHLSTRLATGFQVTLRSRFNAQGTLSYHACYTNITRIRGFGTGFNRQSFSAQDRSMSQLLRYV
jgi:hypothetical protein